MRKVVLFDFDGTIAATAHAGVAIFNEMAREYGFSEITSENTSLLREKNAHEVVRILNIPRLIIPIVVHRLRKGIKAQISTVAIIEGMKSVILMLKERECDLGIVTSNSRENVTGFLKRNDLEVFDYIRAGTGVFYKARAIRKVVSSNNLKGRDVIFIGDEMRDIAAAKKNNMTAIAVTWGINSRAGFEKENADFIVDTTEELSTILLDFCEMSH